MEIISGAKLDGRGGRTVLLYGPNRVGKTTVVRGLPPTVLFLDVDNSPEVIRGCEHVFLVRPILTIADFEGAAERCLATVRTSPGKVSWIVIDSVTILQGRFERIKRHEHRAALVSNADKPLAQKVPANKYDVYTEGADEILRIYEQYFSPVVALGVNVLSICNSEDTKDDLRAMLLKAPAVNVKDFRRTFFNWHGEIVRMRVNDDGSRVLDRTAGPDFLAGDRSQAAPDTMIPRI